MSSKTLHFEKSNNAAPDEIIILQFSNKAVYIYLYFYFYHLLLPWHIMLVSHPFSLYPLLYQQHLRFSPGLFSLLHSSSLHNPLPHILDIDVISATSLPSQEEKCMYDLLCLKPALLSHFLSGFTFLYSWDSCNIEPTALYIYLCTRISSPNSQDFFSQYSAKLVAIDYTKAPPTIFKYSRFSF